MPSKDIVEHNDIDSGAAEPTPERNDVLTLERREQADQTAHIGPAMLAPPVDESYWSYRVRLSDSQAVVAFPKFLTIGIGFAREEDWNTNLPWTRDADKIFDHIAHNKGDDSISDDDVRRAIEMIQAAIRADGHDAGWRDAR